MTFDLEFPPKTKLQSDPHLHKRSHDSNCTYYSCRLISGITSSFRSICSHRHNCTSSNSSQQHRGGPAPSLDVNATSYEKVKLLQVRAAMKRKQSCVIGVVALVNQLVSDVMQLFPLRVSKTSTVKYQFRQKMIYFRLISYVIPNVHTNSIYFYLESFFEDLQLKTTIQYNIL